MRAEVTPLKPPSTVTDIVARFLEHLQVEMEIASPHTLRYYRRWCGRWLAYCARRGIGWLEASREHALGWKLELVQAAGYRHEALRQAIQMGRRLYDWAIDAEWRHGPNPFARLRPPRGVSPVKLAPTEEEIRAMLARDWPSDFRWLRARAVFCLLYGAGLRRNEARMLDVADVSLEQGLVVVNHGKGGTCYVQPLVPYVVTAIREYLAAGRPLLTARACGPLFLGVRGGRISYDGVAADVALVSRRIRRLTPHDLRRGAATHMHQRGATLTEVQRFLRHVSITSTQRYLGIAPQEVQRAVAAYHPLQDLTA